MKNYFIFYIENSYALMRGISETFICVLDNELNKEDVVFFINTYKDNVKIKTIQSIEEPSDAEIFDILYDDEKTTIYIDMDNTIFDYDSAYAKRKQEDPSIEYPQSEKGFFENLEPLEHAIRVVKALIDSPKYNVFFASAPSYYNPHSYTDKRLSIEKHFGFEHVDKLILVCKKDELKNKKRILIDDIDYGYGQENFTNHMHFGSPSCPDWLYVEKVLL